MITFAIDLGTLVYHGIKRSLRPERLDPEDIRNLKVSTIIPAYNEGDALRTAAMSHLEQTLEPVSVILADDFSSDDTETLGNELASQYDRLIYSRNEQNMGKAETLNRIVREHAADLGDYVLIADGDVKLPKNTLEELVARFTDDDIQAVTSSGSVNGTGGFLNRRVSHGKQWLFKIFEWRKQLQSLRNAVSTVNGSCTLYRTDILREHPIPSRTQTEDTDHTWQLIEEGHRVLYEPRVQDRGDDVTTVRKQYTQTLRWYAGTWQTLYRHDGDLRKSKSLLYTTVAPGFLESSVYSIMFFGLPATVAAQGIVGTQIVDPSILAYGFGVDLALTILPTLFIAPKMLKDPLGIYMYKTLSTAAFLHAGAKTTAEKILGREERWSNTWTREQKSRIAYNLPAGRAYLDEHTPALADILDRFGSFYVNAIARAPDLYREPLILEPDQTREVLERIVLTGSSERDIARELNVRRRQVVYARESVIPAIVETYVGSGPEGI